MLDNYLGDKFVPQLFMSHTQVRAALRQLFPAYDAELAWQNALRPLNVDGDALDLIIPLDALLIVNELNAPRWSDPTSRQLVLPPPAGHPPPYLDVNGDKLVTPLDGLVVINYLNAQHAVGGEGEADGTDPQRSIREPPLPSIGFASSNAAWPSAFDQGSLATHRRTRRPPTNDLPLEETLVDSPLRPFDRAE
jgi:hypothetical protein